MLAPFSAASPDRDALYGTMYGVLPLGVVITTLRGVIVWTNASAREMLGAGQGSLVGSTLGSFRANGAQDLLEYRAALLAGESVVREESVRRLDGTDVWLRLHLSLLRDTNDASVHVIALCEDTTERRRLERALESRERGYRAIANALPHTAIFLFDRDRRHVLAEGAPSLASTGLERDKVLGRTIEEVASPANRVRLVKHYNDALAGRSETTEMHRDGKWYEVRIAPVCGDDGVVTGGVTILHEITERVSDRRELDDRARKIRLLETIAERTNQVMSSREALRACLELVCTHAKKAAGHVFVPDEDGKRLVSSGLWYGDLVGPISDFLRESQALSLAPGEGLVGSVYASNEARWVDDLAIDPAFTRRAAAMKAGLKSGGAFPIVMGDEVAAVVELYASEHESADDSLHDIVATVGVQIGRAFERERYEVTLKKRASCDEATGLLNRRGFIATAPERMLAAQDQNHDLVLFFAEIDGLTAINERLGPADGDAAIAAAGAVLRGAFRPSDLLARLGGDEFVVLAEVEPAQIAATKARISEHVRRMNESPLRRFDLALDIVTTTVFADGVAEIAEYLTTGDALMAEARRGRKARRVA